VTGSTTEPSTQPATAQPLAQFSFNQATARHWPLPEAVAGCAAAGVGRIGLWREPVAAYGLAPAAALVRDAGLAVTSLCRGGFFDEPGWRDTNRRAIDEAAALGAPALLLVCGGLPAGCRDLPTARARVGEAIGELVPAALAAGVQLAIEPLHPMYVADRSVVSTLDQALALAAPYPPAAVGVALDSYHLWWDDRAPAAIAEAGRQQRIACCQLADWVTPLPAGVLTGRALPGAGCIDLPGFLATVAAAGYQGPIEVEVFNETLWRRPGPDILAATLDSYRRLPVWSPATR
jgi:sugar phosphate isomerase/epimerase